MILPSESHRGPPRVSLVESSVEKPLLPDAAINAPQTFRVWPHITKTPELLTFLRHPSRNSQRIWRAVAIKPQDSPVIEKIESNDRCLVYLSVDQYSSLTPKNVNTCEDQVFSNQSTGSQMPRNCSPLLILFDQPAGKEHKAL